MPTVISHPAAAIAAAPYWRRRLTGGLFVLGAVCSVLPDADVAAFALGIPYEHPLGHRGFTHSLLFAALVSALAAVMWRRATRTSTSVVAIFSFLLVCTASHGLLDAMTDGGRGVGFFVPFDNGRYFLPFRPIHVSPIGLRFSPRALASEVRWLWLPSLGSPHSVCCDDRDAGSRPVNRIGSGSRCRQV